MNPNIYKEVEELKNKTIEESNHIIEKANQELQKKEVEILKKIDISLKEIAQALNELNKGECKFYSNSWIKANKDDYPSELSVKFNNGDYELQTRLYSPYSSQERYVTQITNGILYMPLSEKYNHLKNDYTKYAMTIIKNWAKLKDSIIKSTMFDYEKVQLEINAKITDIEKRRDLYDNFEL